MLQEKNKPTLYSMLHLFRTLAIMAPHNFLPFVAFTIMIIQQEKLPLEIYKAMYWKTCHDIHIVSCLFTVLFFIFNFCYLLLVFVSTRSDNVILIFSGVIKKKKKKKNAAHLQRDVFLFYKK